METYLPDSSPEIDAVDTAVAAPVSDVKPAAEASTEASKGVETTLIDTVTAALNKGTESPAVTDGKAKANPLDATKDGKADEVVGPETETGKYPKTAQGRIRHLNDELKTYKASHAELERVKPDAELGQNILGYLDKNGIQPDELDNVLAFTAMVKRGDYEAALRAIQPTYQALLDKTGEILPADLKEKVRLGHMTQAVATELHKSRTKAVNAENREKQTTAKTEAERQQTAHTTKVTSAARATSDWDRAQAATDPDWVQKQPYVAKEVELELRRLGTAGYPKTAQEAVGIAEKARATVEAMFKTFAPRPQARQMTTGATSPRAKTQPKSLMEAVTAALGG